MEQLALNESLYGDRGLSKIAGLYVQVKPLPWWFGIVVSLPLMYFS